SLVGSLPRGECSEWNTRGTWTYDGKKRGPLACYDSSGGTSILWADKPNDLLVLAQDPDMSRSDLFAWWRGHATV
ncbi:MAG: hypothetical protein ACLGIF_10750, partial [Actinomycetes bacterium]